jgi:alkylation response protein AidB-like acyl-CoA dehydrogenase
MDLLPSAQEEEVAKAASALLERECPLRHVQEVVSGSASYDGLWAKLAETGWLGLGLPVEFSGAGGGIGEELMLFREVGRYLVPGALLGTMLGAHVAADAGDLALASRLVSGDLRVGLGWSRQRAGDGDLRRATRGPWVVDGSSGIQGLAVVSEEGAAVLVGEINPEGEPLDSMDALSPRRLVPGSGLEAMATVDGDATFWRGLLLLASELAGISEASRDRSVAHTKSREQFGQAIGAFQAVKHRCADMALRSESAWSLVCYAAACFEAALPRHEFYITAAKVIAGQAAIDNSRHAIQNYGAMGFTDELGAHLFLRRAHVLNDTLLAHWGLLERLRRAGPTVAA